MTPIQEIENDLDWREGELAVLRILLSDRSLPKREKTVLLRSAWALLYAHYEGFCKFALAVFYDAVRKSGVNCRSLPFNTQCFALSGPVKKLRNLPTADFITALAAFEVNHLDKSPSFPDIETNSNLYSSTLAELLKDADIVLPSLNLHNKKLDTLVRRRNNIAHGEKDIIADVDYYLQYEDAFKTVAYELALAIDQKING
jgi:MAE_28990/MAE_18760-like HEPN